MPVSGDEHFSALRHFQQNGSELASVVDDEVVVVTGREVIVEVAWFRTSELVSHIPT